MAARSVQLREQAATDIGRAAGYYRSEAGADVAYELEIPDLHVRPIARFPYLVFYVIGEDVVGVWRLLHTKRDIPSAVVGDLDDRFDDPTRSPIGRALPTQHPVCISRNTQPRPKPRTPANPDARCPVHRA